MVDEPAHVKKTDAAAIAPSGEEIRFELITKLAKKAATWARILAWWNDPRSACGFNTPKDKFVWDVSHQSYVHKLLTGARTGSITIRTTNGLNGFSLRTESPHDCYGAGTRHGALGRLGMARHATTRDGRARGGDFWRCRADERDFL